MPTATPIATSETHFSLYIITLHWIASAEYCDEGVGLSVSVCLAVCVFARDHISGTIVGSRAYKIICHLNYRKVPSLSLSRTSTVCLTSPILTLHKSAKFR